MWFKVRPLFIAFITDKMVWPRMSFKIGRLGPGFQKAKCRSLFGKRINASLTNFHYPLFHHECVFFIWGVSPFGKWNFLNSNIFIWILIVGIANLFLICDCRKVDEQFIANCIEIDGFEVAKYEVFHESCIFYNLFSYLILRLYSKHRIFHYNWT